MNLGLFQTQLKEKKDSGNVEDYLSEIVSQFCESFQTLRQCPYVIMNPVKERASAAKILKVYKDQYPETNLADALIEIRIYFDQCINVNDPWLFKNMSLQLIEGKFNQINTVLKNGNNKKSGGATDEQIAGIIAAKFGSDSDKRN
jgi:hypothetical protein